MKTSSTTIIIALLLLITIGGGVYYYYSKKNASIAQAWVESSWTYRKSLYIESTEPTAINKDILLEIDTEALVEAGKLQADCRDLRFQESDNLSTLDYWIESGCNTSITKIRIRISSISSPGKDIYMFYGNPNASMVQEKFEINN